MKIKEGDIVLCTVEKIVGTTVFVKIEENGEGTIIFSEIAPGRIRNIRDYVIPNKKIVCKVLEIEPNGTIHLSLRRVTQKEKKEIMEKFEKENAYKNMLKIVVKEKHNEIIEKIKKEKSLIEFFEEACERPEILKKFFTKEEAEKLIKILKEKKEKLKEVKKEFLLKCMESDGIERIKKILLPYGENITYIAAGRFRLVIKKNTYKEAEKECEKILKEIEEKAKKENCEFKIMEE